MRHLAGPADNMSENRTRYDLESPTSSSGAYTQVNVLKVGHVALIETADPTIGVSRATDVRQQPNENEIPARTRHVQSFARVTRKPPPPRGSPKVVGPTGELYVRR